MRFFGHAKEKARKVAFAADHARIGAMTSPVFAILRIPLNLITPVLLGSTCLAAFVLWAEAPKPENAEQPASVVRVTTIGNSLGMKFVPIPKLPNGLKVLGCIHETRSKDFAVFIADKNHGYDMKGEGADAWRNGEYKGFPVGRGKDEKAEDSSHPVNKVSYVDAQGFCQWLTAKERRQALIGPKDEYRLPSDAEWSLMVGLGEEKGSTPAEKSDQGDSTHYPWGGAYPPTAKAGNYADENAKGVGLHLPNLIRNYKNGTSTTVPMTTAPVMSFEKNNNGFYDLGGNVYEWCEDWYNTQKHSRVLRGGGWYNFVGSNLLSSYRQECNPVGRYDAVGFRCVLVVGSAG